MDKREIEGKDTRRRHGDAFKRELVERSLQPGASVSALAQEHGVNANLLFNWRRLHLRANWVYVIGLKNGPYDGVGQHDNAFGLRAQYEVF